MIIEFSGPARRAAFALLAAALFFAPAALRAGGAPDSTAAVASTAPPAGAPDTAATQQAPPAAPTTPADEANLPPLLPPPDSTLAEALRHGGYILVFRHSVTDWSQRDADGENFENRKAQRNLSAEGRRVAEETGKAIKAAGIPIGEVSASPMWRCRDSADLMFGHHTTNVDLFRRGAPSREVRIRLLGTQPKAGTNAALVTHQDVLFPIITGLRREQLREGEALIVKPLGDGKYEVLAQVKLDQWRALALPKKP